MKNWIGRRLTINFTAGDKLVHTLIELGVAGAMFDDDAGGKLFIPWTAIHSLRLPPGDHNHP
jgi:hypothetical protein